MLPRTLVGDQPDPAYLACSVCSPEMGTPRAKPLAERERRVLTPMALDQSE